jgi:cobalamin-dependent methionine synthase I
VRPMSDSASTSDLLARPMRRQLTKRVVLPAGSSKQASDATNHERHVQALAHDKSQDELISHMRSSAATMRKQFADSKEIARNLKEHEESLQAAMGSSSQELTKMQTFNEEMLADFALMELRPAWDASVSRFLDASLGCNSSVEVARHSLPWLDSALFEPSSYLALA